MEEPKSNVYDLTEEGVLTQRTQSLCEMLTPDIDYFRRYTNTYVSELASFLDSQLGRHQALGIKGAADFQVISISNDLSSAEALASEEFDLKSTRELNVRRARFRVHYCDEEVPSIILGYSFLTLDIHPQEIELIAYESPKFKKELAEEQTDDANWSKIKDEH